MELPDLTFDLTRSGCVSARAAAGEQQIGARQYRVVSRRVAQVKSVAVLGGRGARTSAGAKLAQKTWVSGRRRDYRMR